MEPGGGPAEGGDVLLLAATAIQTVNTWPWKKLDPSLGSGATYSLSRSSSGPNNDDFGHGHRFGDGRRGIRINFGFPSV